MVPKFKNIPKYYSQKMKSNFAYLDSDGLQIKSNIFQLTFICGCFSGLSSLKGLLLITWPFVLFGKVSSDKGQNCDLESVHPGTTYAIYFAWISVSEKYCTKSSR